MSKHSPKGKAWHDVRMRVLQASNICWLCGQPGADSVDHLVPVSLGGAKLDIGNLAPAHLTCNKRRGNGRGMRDLSGVAQPTSRRW